MAGDMWFGTREYMQWVPAPALNIDASKRGWQTETAYMNGGAYVRRSVTAHKRFSMAWNLTTRERIRSITDYADGLYGDGPIYWADPFTMDTNMLPAYWAAPFMGTEDGPILSGSEYTRPEAVPSPNDLGYPLTSALYTVGTDPKPSVWIPIPPGYTAWVGAHGQAGTGGTVVATPTTGPGTPDAPVTLTLLSVADSTRFNQSFDSSSYSGVLISLGGSGTVTLSGLMVQVLPSGLVPPSGGFISGQGHSGASFVSQPVLTQYSAVYDRVGLTAELVETNAWL